MGKIKVVSIEIDAICPKCSSTIHIKVWTSPWGKNGLLEGTRKHTCENCYEDIFWCLITSSDTEKDKMLPELIPYKSF